MKNKTILILGASSDIGLATCEVFLKKNWNIIGHYYLNKKSLKLLEKKYPNKVTLFKLNLENPVVIKTFLKKKKEPIL